MTDRLTGFFQQIDAYITGRMVQKSTPGMVVAFLDREGYLRVAAYGYADLETRLPMPEDALSEIGSITKTFTALAVLQASEAGLLDLHAPVTRYLPWFEVRSSYGEPITLHHLLTHSAGLIGVVDKSPDMRGAVWALRDTEAASPPGVRFSYSDAGYQTLALVLERVTGLPFAEVIRRQIFEPLGMSGSTASITHDLRPRMTKGYRHLYDDRPSHPRHPLVPATWVEVQAGDSSVASTAADMAKFATMLLNGGAGLNGRLISEDGFALMTRRWMVEEWGAYGYGMMVHERDGITHIGHSGGMIGYSAELLADVDNGLGLVILCNHTIPRGLHWVLMRLWREAYAGLQAAEDRIPLQVPDLPDPLYIENAADYAGVYKGDQDGPDLVLLAEEGQLLLGYKGERVALEGRGPDAFYVDHPDFALFLLHFGRAGGDDPDSEVLEAWYGSDVYTKESQLVPAMVREHSTPEEWQAYMGHYRSHIPWQTNFRVLLRKGQLWLVWPDGDEEPLLPIGDNLFRIGDQGSPETITFQDIADSQALRATLASGDYYRFFTP